MIEHKIPAVDFMVRLKLMDRSLVTTRDAICLWAIKSNPGTAGRELALKLGYAARSSIEFNVARLVRLGYIQDRRENVDPLKPRLTPNSFYITPDGDAFLDELLPK